MSLSPGYRKKENCKRRELLKRLIAGDAQFVNMLAKFWGSESHDNRRVSEYFGVGKTNDSSNQHRKNLRGIRTRSKGKVSAADIAWMIEDAFDGLDPSDLGISTITKEELSAFFRMTTLLYVLMEIYP